jgi:hypothetical protein
VLIKDLVYVVRTTTPFTLFVYLDLHTSSLFGKSMTLYFFNSVNAVKDDGGDYRSHALYHDETATDASLGIGSLGCLLFQ